MSQWGIRPILTNGGAEVKGENASSRTTTTPTRPKPPDPSTPKVVSRINLFNPFKSFNFGCDASRLGFVNDSKRRQYDASGGMRAQSPTAGSKGSRAGPPYP